MEKHFTAGFFAGKKVHIGVCGSISAYKTLELLRACVSVGIIPTVTLTESACRFIRPLSFSSLGAEEVYTAMFRDDSGVDGKAPLTVMETENFAHLMPGAECDAFVIMPASATTMARIATGFADEILSAQALSWPKSILIAPAMNPRMWNSPATKNNVEILSRYGHEIICPSCGKVACGEEGQGKLADTREIYVHLLRQIAPKDLAGKKVMLTLGPTREQWDGVRYWSNLSSGIMGASLAIAAWLRGAEVTAICGPCGQFGTAESPWLPGEINRIDVRTGQEMHSTAVSEWNKADIGVCAAAVADFYPEPIGTQKFKKNGAKDNFSINFKMNPDILSELGESKQKHQKLIGFAAETENLEKNTREKRIRKNADLLVGNIVGVSDSGFGSATNRVFMVDTAGREENLPVLPKADVAWRIFDWLLTL